jgi:MOSC domain-containing protein YiiM
MGRLTGIARRDRKRAPMQTLERADISAETGVALDFRGKPGPRQVTVVSARAWKDACGELQKEIPWTTRRANLLVDDFELPRSIGAILKVGEVRLRITGEVDPCSRMEEQCPGLKQALQPEWRGGVSCTVVEGGAVAVGDEVIAELDDSGR